mgnify:CR=1 FL=1
MPSSSDLDKEQRWRDQKERGADHFFDGREGALVNIVSTWLNEVVPASQ